jgi:hypothetical protein
MDFVVTLCIDNQAAREKVLKSSFKIESVPCLIVTYPGGGVEKFEGAPASHWIDNLLGQLRPAPKAVEAPRYAPPQRVAQEPLEEDEEDRPEPVRRQRRAPGKLSTNIDELLDLDEDGDDSDDEQSRTKQRKDPLNGLAPRIANPRTKSSDVIDDSEIDPNLIDEKVKKAVKGESGNIMAQAQAMQKQRDKENEKVRLPVGN